MLRKGAIELVPKRLRGSGVYSRYFLVKKKTGGWRPILDLRRLNKFIKAQKFRMVTLQHVLGQLEEGDFLSSLDLEDAYFHIPILKGHRKFLRFVVQGRHYQFRALPSDYGRHPGYSPSALHQWRRSCAERGSTSTPTWTTGSSEPRRGSSPWSTRQGPSNFSRTWDSP